MQYDDGVRGEGGRGCYPGPSGAGCCANAAGFRACRRSPPGPAPQAVLATTCPGEAGGKTGAEAGREERKAAGRSGETGVTYGRCGADSTAWCFACCCPTWGGEASSPRGCGTGGGDSRIGGATSAWRGNTWRGGATSSNASGGKATNSPACHPRRGYSGCSGSWGSETSCTWRGNTWRSDPTSGNASGGPAGNTYSPRCCCAWRSSTWICGATCGGNAESNTSEGGTPEGATSCGSTPNSHSTCRTGRTWGFGAENRGPGGCDPWNGTSTRRKATRSYAANGQAPCRCSPGGETTNSHPTRGDAPWVEAGGIARRKASRGKTPGGATTRRKATGSEAADGETTNDTA